MSKPKRPFPRSPLQTVILGGTALLMVIGIVRSPGESFQASLAGLQIWWQQVFPGLIPPLILAELLAASGLLHGLAVLAEPLTRALFRLPGAAGWAIAFGWTAGVPAGAKETARLRESGLVEDKDTDTLVLVSHIPNPFLVVAIAGAGFLRSPALGWAMAFGVWSSAVLSGVVWSRLGQSSSAAARGPAPGPVETSPFRRAARAAAAARRADGRPLGKQLADGVANAVAAMMMVGGLMMMASVILRLLQLWIPDSDAWLAVPGLYEMHLGAYETSRSPLLESAPAQAAAMLAAALAWTGWSGLLQARAVFGPTGRFPWLKIVAGKLLQSALALLLTFPLAKAALHWIPPGSASEPGSAVWPGASAIQAALHAEDAGWLGWRQWPEVWLAGLACLAVFLLLALLAAVIRPKPRRPAVPPGPPGPPGPPAPPPAKRPKK